MDPANAPVYDIAEILGIGPPSTDPLPDAESGFVTLRIPEGLTLQALRGSPVGQQLMYSQNWYDRYPWSEPAPAAGVYRLRIPVPGSNRKTAAEQVALLPEGESLAPVALVAAALLCISFQGRADPLNGGWTHCAEQSADGYRVELTWCVGRLLVDGFWGDNRYGSLWASSVRAS